MSASAEWDPRFMSGECRVRSKVYEWREQSKVQGLWVRRSEWDPSAEWDPRFMSGERRVRSKVYEWREQSKVQGLWLRSLE